MTKEARKALDYIKEGLPFGAQVEIARAYNRGDKSAADTTKALVAHGVRFSVVMSASTVFAHDVYLDLE